MPELHDILAELVRSEAGHTRGLQSFKFHSLSKEFDKAGKLLKNLPKAVQDKVVQEALYKGAQKTKTVIRQHARRAFNHLHWKQRRALRPGEHGYGGLYGSIKAKRGKPEYYPSAYVRVGGSGAMHANLIEYGTKFMKHDHEFIKPGIQAAQAQQDRAVLDTSRKLLPEAADEAWRLTNQGVSGL